MKLWYGMGLIVIVCALLIVGCASTQKTTAHPDFKKLCSQCHSLDVVEKAHDTLTKEDMKKIVTRMSQKPKSQIDMNSIDDIVEQIY